MTTTGQSQARRTPGWARWFVPLHLRLYRATGGLLGHRLGPQRTLLLTTTGRTTGLPRTQPVTYFRFGDELALVASNWGNDRPPAWYLNLVAAPHAQVQLKREVFDVTATAASADERARLWPRVVAKNPRYARYQQATAREIPLVILRRAPRDRTA